MTRWPIFVVAAFLLYTVEGTCFIQAQNASTFSFTSYTQGAGKGLNYHSFPGPFIIQSLSSTDTESPGVRAYIAVSENGIYNNVSSFPSQVFAPSEVELICSPNRVGPGGSESTWGQGYATAMFSYAQQNAILPKTGSITGDPLPGTGGNQDLSIGGTYYVVSIKGPVTVNYTTNCDSSRVSSCDVHVKAIDGSFDETITGGAASAQLTGLNPNTTYEVQVRVVDTWGCKWAYGAYQPFVLNPQDPPTASIHLCQNYKPGTWTNALGAPTPLWTVNIGTKQQLGIDEVDSTNQLLYSATSSDSSQATAVGDATQFGGIVSTPQPTGSASVSIPADMPDGYYFLKVHAASCFGQTSDSIYAVPFEYDNTEPVVSNVTASPSADAKSINMSWTATDNLSGVASCSVSYQVPGEAAATVPATSISASGNSYSATIPIGSMYGSAVAFSVSATDNAGNTSGAQTASVAVPPQLAMSAIVVPYGAESTQAEQVNQDYMEVDLDFGLPEAALKSFSSLTVARVQANPGTSAVQLPPLSIDPSMMPTALSVGGASPGGTPWELGANGVDVIYADYIPVSSGAGHKAWTYTLTSALYGASGASWNGISPASGTVNLPNNQGTVSFPNANIVDMKGNPYGSSGFTVGATGEVQIEIQGNDPDEDSWGVEVDKVTQVTEPTASGGSYTFTSYSSLSGKGAIRYAYPYGNVLVPVNLSVGDNNIELVWTEGTDTTVEHSQVLDLVLKQSNGEYTLTVTDGYGNQVGGTDGGLTVAPWQPLQFSVSPSTASGITWVWGDGSPNSSGASATHAYQQAANQTTSSCSYQLTIELPGGTSIPLTVTVQDTQKGALWGDEVWHGDHTVLGVVVVPQNLSLTIASGNVSFQGDLGAGFGQGITVQGDLQIAGGVTLEPEAGQSQGWGTILVDGTAEIGASGWSTVTIEGADRGIAADAGSAVTLVNTTLMKNLTGIQVVGTQDVTITGCNITGNTVYGIKEDSGGRPTVMNTTIKGNFRDYYQWDGGLLTIIQINALGKNSGNQGA